LRLPFLFAAVMRWRLRGRFREQARSHRHQSPCGSEPAREGDSRFATVPAVVLASPLGSLI